MREVTCGFTLQFLTGEKRSSHGAQSWQSAFAMEADGVKIRFSRGSRKLVMRVGVVMPGGTRAQESQQLNLFEHRRSS